MGTPGEWNAAGVEKVFRENDPGDYSFLLHHRPCFFQRPWGCPAEQAEVKDKMRRPRKSRNVWELFRSTVLRQSPEAYNLLARVPVLRRALGPIGF